MNLVKFITKKQWNNNVWCKNQENFITRKIVNENIKNYQKIMKKKNIQMKVAVEKIDSANMMEATNAKYLLDYLYFTRDDEQFRFIKKVSLIFHFNFNKVIFNFWPKLSDNL